MPKQIEEEVVVEDKPAVKAEPMAEDFDPWEEDIEVVEDEVVEEDVPAASALDPNIQKMAETVSGLTEVVRAQVEEKNRPKPKINTTKPLAPVQKINLQALEEKLDKDIFDKPSKELQPYIKALIFNEVAPTIRKQAETIKRLERQVSKHTVDTEDVTASFVMNNYADEVEALVDSEPGENAYQNAVTKVAMNHLGELVQAQVQAAAASVPNAVPQPTSMSRGTVNTTRTPGRNAWKLKGKSLAEYNAAVQRRDKGFVDEMWKEQGWLVKE